MWRLPPRSRSSIGGIRQFGDRSKQLPPVGRRDTEFFQIPIRQIRQYTQIDPVFDEEGRILPQIYRLEPTGDFSFHCSQPPCNAVYTESKCMSLALRPNNLPHVPPLLKIVSDQ